MPKEKGYHSGLNEANADQASRGMPAQEWPDAQAGVPTHPASNAIRTGDTS